MIDLRIEVSRLIDASMIERNIERVSQVYYNTTLLVKSAERIIENDEYLVTALEDALEIIRREENDHQSK